MEVTDFLEIVILCLSLLIVIPILMVIWIDWERIDSKRETDGSKERNNNRRNTSRIVAQEQNPL